MANWYVRTPLPMVATSLVLAQTWATLTGGWGGQATEWYLGIGCVQAVAALSCVAGLGRFVRELSTRLGALVVLTGAASMLSGVLYSSMIDASTGSSARRGVFLSDPWFAVSGAMLAVLVTPVFAVLFSVVWILLGRRKQDRAMANEARGEGDHL